MAFFQRARDIVSRGIRGIGSVFRQTAPEPPFRQPPSPEPPPPEPFGFPAEPAYEPDYIEVPDRRYEFDDEYPYEITLVDDFGEPYSFTFDQWYELTLLDKDTLLNLFYMDNLDIIYQLESLGYEWDWEAWRADYEARHG